MTNRATITVLLTIFLASSCQSTKPNAEKTNEIGNSKAKGYKMGVDTMGHFPKGVEIGERAPTFKTSEVSLEEAIRSKPVVIIFYRGDWCPVCNRYLAKVEDSLSALKEKAHIWVIGPQKQVYIENSRQKSGLSAIVIPDTTYAIMKQYDVLFDVTEKYQKKINNVLNRDIASSNNGEAKLPVPATFIISQDGEIFWRQFDLNYKNRASVEQIKEQLDKIPSNE